MILQDHLAGVVQGGADGSQLDEHLGAVVPLLHHPLDLLQMADGPGQAVNDCLLIFVDMAVGVGDAVGVEVGVVVFLLLLMIVAMAVLVFVKFGHTQPSSLS